MGEIVTRRALITTGLVVTPAFVALVLSVTAAFAAPADLDPSFSLDGRLVIDSGGYEAGNAVALQPDGKIVVAGSTSIDDNAAVYRLNPDGSFDTTFDTDGARSFGAPGTQTAQAVAVQPDGKIVVAGTSGGQYGVVWRLNPDGSFDTSFGLGGKVLITNVGVGVLLRALALQPDGRIVVAGYTLLAPNDAVVYRLNPNGSFDTTFDTDGLRSIDSGGREEAYALALQPNGKILVAGSTTIDNNAAVYRLNPDGSFDTTFDTDGARGIDSGSSEVARAVALQPDGKIVVAGSTGNNSDAAFYRLNPDGSFDTTFDADGQRIIAGSGDEQVNAVALQPDGKILGAGRELNNVDGAVYRLNPDGSSDTTFGTGGSRNLDNGGDEVLNAVALQPDGKIVLVGSTSIDVNGDVLVYRLQGDPRGGGGGGGGGGGSTGTGVDAKLVAAKVVRNSRDARLVRVELTAREQIVVELTLVRQNKTLAEKRVDAFQSDDGFISLSIPKSVKKGPATLRIMLTDVDQNLRAFTRQLTIPKVKASPKK